MLMKTQDIGYVLQKAQSEKKVIKWFNLSSSYGFAWRFLSFFSFIGYVLVYCRGSKSWLPHYTPLMTSHQTDMFTLPKIGTSAEIPSRVLASYPFTLNKKINRKINKALLNFGLVGSRCPGLLFLFFDIMLLLWLAVLMYISILLHMTFCECHFLEDWNLLSVLSSLDRCWVILDTLAIGCLGSLLWNVLFKSHHVFGFLLTYYLSYPNLLWPENFSFCWQSNIVV